MNRKNSGKIILGLFILTNLVYVFMLTITIPKTLEYSNGMQLPDMMPTGYDHEYIQKLFTTLGEVGRQYYLTRQIVVDMFYPALFAISYALIFAFFLQRLGKLKSPWVYLSFLPVIAGVADYLENTGNILLLNNFPALNMTLVSFTNFFTILKSMTSTVYFLALIVILVILGIKFLGRKKRSEGKFESNQKIAN
jgi:hypothetical protein